MRGIIGGFESEDEVKSELDVTNSSSSSSSEEEEDRDKKMLKIPVCETVKYQSGLQVFPTGKCLVVPRFGSLFRVIIKSSSGAVKSLPIIPSPEPQKFYALFNEDDVDFKIDVDNSLCTDRDVAVSLEILKENATFVIHRGEQDDFETLTSGGRKFHFVSQNSLEGQATVGMHAMKYGQTFAAASASVSQIGFGVRYSKPARPKVVTVETADTFTICVKTLTGKKLIFRVNPEDTIKLLKMKIDDIEDIPLSQQRLIFAGQQMQDDRALRDYEIKDGATIHFALRLCGGGGGPISIDESLSDDGDDEQEFPKGMKMAVVAERGAIVLRGKSKQRFQNCQFAPDRSVLIDDFVIELRRGCTLDKPLEVPEEDDCQSCINDISAFADLCCCQIL